MKKIALVTGATAGFGEAIAIKLAESGYNLIITGRRDERLQDLKEKLAKDFGTESVTLCFDVRDKEAVDMAIDSLKGDWKNIDLLVNNAGLAVGLGPIQEGVVDDWERMIDTNVKGLLYVTRKISPTMVERKKGHIINIGSTAGKDVYLNGNVYCGTKHAVNAISQAMRIDMLPYNIKVTQIRPGLAETEFSVVRFKGDKDKADATYKNIEPLYAKDIADAVLFVATRPDSVNINDLEITCTAQANSYYVHK
ncbi:MAG: SDR family NAD(P)-dependent oxidoreductase [Bacteroidales bacterium]|jgi:NADP-dependent 3-hydroxy acid dehydrogenase YdfG|nr:SDR family NAD(P)-dependent oxidoreductase [Bacteroidales bacterium]